MYSTLVVTSNYYKVQWSHYKIASLSKWFKNGERLKRWKYSKNGHKQLL